MKKNITKEIRPQTDLPDSTKDKGIMRPEIVILPYRLSISQPDICCHRKGNIFKRVFLPFGTAPEK